MTDKELERRLEQALSRCAPDDLEGVLSRCQTRKGTVIPMTAKTPKRAIRNLIAACLTLVVVGGGAVGYQYKTVNTVASIVSLDVNPSIELTVNKNEKVLSATPMNEDANVILEGMDLKGANVEVAMNAIIGSLLQHGYVDELANSILITVEDDDAQRGEKLQQELTAQADAALANAKVNGAILAQTLQHSDTLSQLAEEYGISAGKAALIQTIVEGSQEPKTFEDLVGLSINELNLIYTSMTQNAAQQEGTGEQGTGTAVIGGADGPTGIFTTGPIQTSGTASQSAYIGVDAAQAAALAHAGLSASQATILEVDYDWEDGRMVYEVEFRTSEQEYEYEIDALTGDVVKYETEAMGGYRDYGASPSSYIGEAAAKAAALSHAGVKESDTAYCNVWLEYDDGRAEHYQVEFAAGSTRYEYEIALTSATVLKQEQKQYTQAAGAGTSGSAGSAGGTGGGSSADIGEEAAKSAALSHAGVSQADASFTKVEREYDDGRLEYELEFWAGNTEYDYTVSAADGVVLQYDVENHMGAGSAGAGTSSDIGSASAKSVAFQHAGVSEADVYGLEVDRDYDDGRLEYDVEFKAGGKEYEYTIDGATGSILEYESDWD